MATKKRRGAKHRGVSLIPPKAARRTGWVARYRDPDSEKIREESLPAAQAATAESRAEWAVRKSRDIAKRRLELEGGAPRATGTALDAALDRYFEGHPLLRDRTRKIYRSAADKLAAWRQRAWVKDGE